MGNDALHTICLGNIEIITDDPVTNAGYMQKSHPSWGWLFAEKQSLAKPAYL